MSEATDFVDEFFVDASNLSQPLTRRHRVDVVLVTHDGARWLPRTLAALRNSGHRPDAVHVIDTGSIDGTAEILANASATIDSIQHAPREQAYGASLAQAIAQLPEVDPEHTDVAWIWLIHDDSAPAADALHALLRASELHPDASILGCKSVGWNDSSRLQDVGLTMTGTGHRDVRIERGERDQGQYMETEEVLAVGSAGMLIRRDVWQTLNGMRPIFAFYRDDIDFCWRAWEHGYRVRVVPQAEIAHREASTHAVRLQDVRPGSAHRIGRENSLAASYIHARSLLRPFLLVRLVIASLTRAFVYFVGKDPRDSGDELRALFAFLRSPLVLMREVESRGVIPIRAPRRLRPSIWVQMWHGFDLVATLIIEKVDDLLEVWAGSDAFDVIDVEEDADDADEATSEETFVVAKSRRQSFLAQVWKRPGTLLFLALTTIGILGTRNLWASGALEGGALLPVTTSAGDLLRSYFADWHNVGLGSGAGAAPWAPLLAIWSLLFFGNLSAAVTALLVFAIPMAGLSAHLAARKVIAQAEPRAFFAGTYALMPGLVIAISNGHLGTIVFAIALPALLRLAWRCDETWARAAVMAVAMAFTAAWVPVVWLFSLVWAIIAAVLWRRDREPRLRIAFVVVAAWLMLFPVSAEWIQHPSLLLREAGASVPIPDGQTFWHVLLLQPGGADSPTLFAMLGLLLGAAAALIQRRRARRVVMGWMIAVIMFSTYVVVTVVASRMTISDPATGEPLVQWAGPFTLILGTLLLIIIAEVTDGLAETLAARSFGWRHLVTVFLTVFVALAPVLSAGSWLWRNGESTVTRSDVGAIPAFVLAKTSTAAAERVIVLQRDTQGVVRYSVFDGADATIGDADVQRDIANREITSIVGSMLSGRDRTDAQRLAGFGIMYVVANDGDPVINDALDGAVGLRRLSGGTTGAASTWAVQAPNERVALLWLEGGTRIVEPLDYTVNETLRAKVRLDAAESKRILTIAEPEGAWSATVNGKTLASAPAYTDAWRQAWVVPAGADGKLVVSFQHGQRLGAISFQLLILIIALVIALPTYRPYADEDADGEVVSA